MSEGVRIGNDISPDRTRYRVLLEIIDIVSRAPSLPEAFKEFAKPWLDLSHGEFPKPVSPRQAPELHAQSVLETKPGKWRAEGVPGG
jgi:hypothetical protein